MANGYIISEYVNIDSNGDVVSTSQKYIEDSVAIATSIHNSSDFIDATFTQMDSNNIQFSTPFLEPQTMVLEYSVKSNGLLNDVISNNNSSPNSVFKKYGTDTKLQKNNKYLVHIALKDFVQEWSFTTETNPRYTSVGKIRGDTGDLLDATTDEEINRMIYSNSKELQFIIDDKVRVEGAISDANLLLRAKNAYKFWVRYKTDLDLINAIYLSICGARGVNMKKIGDIQISKELNVSSLKNMMDRFSTLFTLYDDTVMALSESMVSFTKAVKNNSYTSRGSF